MIFTIEQKKNNKYYTFTISAKWQVLVVLFCWFSCIFVQLVYNFFLCTFYFIDNNKSSRLDDKENDQFKILNFINNTMFHSLEPKINKSVFFFTWTCKKTLG